MAAIISISDLPASIQSHELAGVMVDGANAKASRVAPCLASTDPAPTAEQVAEAQLVLIGAVKRWAETEAGAYQSQTAGPFGIAVDTRRNVGFNLRDDEVKALQDICAGEPQGRELFAIDTATGTSLAHADTCSINFGATYCSCGAVLTGGYPLYGA